MRTDIAILGFGVVGAGTAKVLEMNKEEIARRTGTEIYVKHILDLRDFPDSPFADRVTHNADDVFGDKDIKIAVETIGGAKIAYEYTKKALSAGITVVTSNKELVSTHGVELLKIAKENGCQYMFEAAVGGGIPIIRPLYRCLAANKVVRIAGIVNGTTNYILTQMKDNGISLDEAVSQAQQNGYAERNPEADIEGRDACRKIAILSSIAYGRDVRYQKVYTEGISKITAEDMKYANAMGCSIKLLGQSRIVNGGIYAMVCPTLINVDNPLYSVQGVFNAIFVHGNVLGDAMFYGSGAGSLPTASAVVADVVDCAKHRGDNVMNQWSDEEISLIDVDEVRGRFFVRVAGSLAGELNNVKEVFGDVEPVSIPGTAGEFGFITKEMSEREYKEKAAKLPDIITMIRARV